MLGILWNSHNDYLSFSTDIEALNQTITKRKVLSLIARLYDPLGLLFLIVRQFKVFMQSLWVKEAWMKFYLRILPTNGKLYQELTSVNTLNIPFWLGTLNSSRLEIYGFGDASKYAMCASVFSRILYDNVYQMKLVVAKTKVAPLKTQSTPRLELCASLFCRPL